jgi:hypothetical protein
VDKKLPERVERRTSPWREIVDVLDARLAAEYKDANEAVPAHVPGDSRPGPRR